MGGFNYLPEVSTPVSLIAAVEGQEVTREAAAAEAVRDKVAWQMEKAPCCCCRRCRHGHKSERRCL